MERSRVVAAYGVHSITRDGNYRYLPEGKFKQVVRPVRGAVAEYEAGSDTSRATVTRVAAGALLAGPAGAIVGGLFKKNTGRGYVAVKFADGAGIIIEGPLKDEPRMRKFAATVSELGSTT